MERNTVRQDIPSKIRKCVERRERDVERDWMGDGGWEDERWMDRDGWQEISLQNERDGAIVIRYDF